MKYIIGYDVGNTNTSLGFYPIDSIAPEKIFRYRTERDITSDELGLLADNFFSLFQKGRGKMECAIVGAVYSSVVNEVDDQYRRMHKKYYNLNQIEVNCYLKLGITIKYDNPEELGADRIANAVAAINEYMKDCIVVDLGTANTFCVVLGSGIFDGGIISPGIGITRDILNQKTSKLMKVDFEKPEKLIAGNTKEAIKSGIFFGSLYSINGIIAGIEELYKNKFQIILTGGYAEIIGEHLGRNCIIDPLLTMKGLKYLYNMNSTL